MAPDQSDSIVIKLLALTGVLIVNAGAVYLIVYALHNPAAYAVASIVATLAAIFIDIVVIRSLLQRRRTTG